MKNYIEKSMNYAQYVALLDRLLIEGKTTGSNQSADYLNYAKLNVTRMHRLNKTSTLTDSLTEQLKIVKSRFVFLVITEGWCGDAAQNLPILNVIEQACKNIELRLILRDENLELMDRFLTDGGRAIPKLICLEKLTLKEIFIWGPRPQAAQKIMLELKNQKVHLTEKAEKIHKWYAEDKTLSLQAELTKLIETHLF